MIFAAGEGRRLRPLTEHLPKALVEVGGKPMILHVLQKLCAAGVGEVVVNVHHHAEKVRSFFENQSIEGIRIHISDETEQLLDTGGGLLKAADFLKGEQPFFLHNVDVLSDVRLDALWEAHQRHRPLATLAVSPRSSSRYFLWHKNLLAGWENSRSGECIICRETPAVPISGQQARRVNPSGTQPSQHAKAEEAELLRRAFSGIHLVEPQIFSLMDEKAPFAIKDLYLRLAGKHRIIAFEHDAAFWADIGSPEKLENARRLYLRFPKG